MVGLLAMVLLSVVSRQLHFHVAGTDAYAGYLMAAAGFLALAHTLKRGEHIRVTLIVSALSGARRHREWALFAATLLGGAVGVLMPAGFAWQSHAFNDVSTGNDATPLWIRSWPSPRHGDPRDRVRRRVRKVSASCAAGAASCRNDEPCTNE